MELNKKSEVIKKTSHFDKRVKEYCSYTIVKISVICLYRTIYHFSPDSVINLQVKCHNKSCQIYLVIDTLKLTFPYKFFKLI